eukprot:g77322.t1
MKNFRWKNFGCDTDERGRETPVSDGKVTVFRALLSQKPNLPYDTRIPEVRVGTQSYSVWERSTCLCLTCCFTESIASVMTHSRSSTRSSNSSTPISSASSLSTPFDTSPASSPSWIDLVQVPVKLATKAEWEKLGVLKQLAVLCRVCVIHLTVTSAAAPCLVLFATEAVNLFLAMLWIGTLVLWHLSHNMLNDLQDMQGGLDVSKSFRLMYGSHPLAQGFISKQYFFVVLGLISAAAAILSLYIGWCYPVTRWSLYFGFIATLIYTPMAKPYGWGEILVLLVWGPAMYGGGYAIMFGRNRWVTSCLQSLPLALGAAGMIFGKHIDKFEESKQKRVWTLPVLLGEKTARAVCAAVLVGKHVVLVLLVRLRVLPVGALLTMVSAFFETRGAVEVLLFSNQGLGLASDALLFPFQNSAQRANQVAKRQQLLKLDPSSQVPHPSLIFSGSLVDFECHRTWPLWYVAAAGWDAVMFAYYFCLGTGLEGLWRHHLALA